MRQKNLVKLSFFSQFWALSKMFREWGGKNISKVVELPIYKSRGTIWGTFYNNSNFCQNFLLRVQMTVSWGKSSRKSFRFASLSEPEQTFFWSWLMEKNFGFSNLKSSCKGEQFETKKFLKKLFIFLSLGLWEKNTFRQMGGKYIGMVVKIPTYLSRGVFYKLMIIFIRL